MQGSAYRSSVHPGQEFDHQARERRLGQVGFYLCDVGRYPFIDEPVMNTKAPVGHPIRPDGIGEPTGFAVLGCDLDAQTRDGNMQRAGL